MKATRKKNARNKKWETGKQKDERSKKQETRTTEEEWRRIDGRMHETKNMKHKR